MRPFVCLVALAVASLFAVPAQAQSGGAYGGMYVTGGSTAQALSTTAAKMTGFATAAVSSSSDGDQSIVTTIASDVVTLQPGTYMATFNVSAAISVINVEATFSLRNGATAVGTGTSCVIESSDAAATASGGFCGIFTVSSEATISVYAAAETGTPNLTPSEAQLTLVRLK